MIVVIVMIVLFSKTYKCFLLNWYLEGIEFQIDHWVTMYAFWGNDRPEKLSFGSPHPTTSKYWEKGFFVSFFIGTIYFVSN